MIRHLPINVKDHLLSLFNKFFRDSFFPHQWELAIIIPIPKPGKDHSNHINYRPISLTSRLCKVFERLINNRIIEFIQINNSLNNIQCEGRKHRSTVDHLVRLESTIRKAFAHWEYFILIYRPLIFRLLHSTTAQ